MEFTTSFMSPSVKTVSVTDINTISARIEGEVTGNGGSDITERGVCWSIHQNPTLEDSLMAAGTTGIGPFTCNVAGLVPGTKYYVRAYAKNSYGIGFGEELEFTTSNAVMRPTVSTVEINNITVLSATAVGNVSSDGGATIIYRGFCYSKIANPTIENSHIEIAGTTGVFEGLLQNLDENTTYHVRAYATNSKGTSYGDDITFTTTEGLPVVVTTSVTDITDTSAKCGGNVTDQGASNVTERGICWSTEQYPTVNGSHANGGSGAGSFTCTMTGLTTDTKYYVRAYAKNTQGLTYGSEVTFETSQGTTSPVVITSEVTEITYTTARGGGNVTADGGATVFERGICWSTSPNPTIDGSHAGSGSGLGEFTVQMNGLSVYTTYYVKAYAINSAGLGYGSEVTFTTNAMLPTVSTNNVTNITETSAVCGGNVTSDGGIAVTARGVCWSTSQNPTIEQSHTTDDGGTGSFTSSISNLSPNTTYYVRAYATNNAGTSYGAELSFTTQSDDSNSYVDLGLPSGLLWATCNVGAENPEDYGNYYAWGETTTKNYYGWNGYQWCNGSYNTLTKYCTNSSYGYNGFVDNKTVLEMSDDAARANWGGDWRMPTKTEMEELKNNCTWTWTTQNGKDGYCVTGPNGNSIFLPAAGCYYGGSLRYAGSSGYYWSSSLNTDYPDYAYYLYFNSGNVNMNVSRRYYGLSVRPVCPSQN